MARKAETVGVAKVNLDAPSLFALAVLAGAFIALGSIFATTVTTGTANAKTGLDFGQAIVLGMYFIPTGSFVKGGAAGEFWQTTAAAASDFTNLTWSNFLFANLLLVTIGNIVGGVALVGVAYWFIYQRPQRPTR